ncbi:MAG: GLPGLI family protein [Ginsengibacter sp.]
MKIKIFISMMFLFLFAETHAQIFISKATIEYEVKSDIKKTMGNNNWDNMLKDKLPRFKTGIFNLTFDNDKSIYQFDHWGPPKLPNNMLEGEDAEKDYFNFATGKYVMQKNVEGSLVIIADSIPKLKWKLVNENREIAGFNCRKAYAVMLDSVYVFAFYTEEITLPGGPATFHGLPGTIMGITIPRLYTSWIATKVMVNGVDASVIKPIQAKKSITFNELKTVVMDRVKDWYTSDDPDENKEIQQRKTRFIWETLL